MRLTIARGFDEETRREIIKPLHDPRKEMLSKMIIYYYILVGALRSRAPLPHTLPEVIPSIIIYSIAGEIIADQIDVVVLSELFHDI